MQAPHAVHMTVAPVASRTATIAKHRGAKPADDRAELAFALSRLDDDGSPTIGA